jgi:hypothetical protein
MSIPAGLIKCVIYGDYANTDIWETGFWVSGALVSSQSDLDTLATAIQGCLFTSGLRTTVLGMLTSNDSMNGMRAYYYNGGPTALYVSDVPDVRVGTGAGNLPYQTAQVVTTLTGAAGRTARGRMYWPAHGAGFAGSTPFWDNGECGALAAGVAAFFIAVNALAGGLLNVVVVSQTRSSSRAVTQVRVDNKPDIQRRRANKVVPTFTTTVAV